MKSSRSIAESARGRVAAVRAFNRFYTSQIGVLDEHHLQSPFTLGEVRVLFELAHRARPTAAELATALQLDPGYLSRAVGRLEQRKLVARKPNPDDARQRLLALTARGRATFAELDARADADISRVLARVPEPDQARLVEAMATIRAALAPSRERPAGRVRLRPPRAGDLGWIVQRHGELYEREYGWNAEFEHLVAGIVGKFAARHDPRRERAWIAEREGERAGCILVVAKSPAVAQLRLLLVEPSARGLGLGGRLVDECLRFARAAGYTKIVLWTQSVLHAARAIYQRAGFALAREAPHHSFGHDLVEQIWQRPL